MFNVKLDISEILDLVGVDQAVVKAARKAASELAAATHAHIVEEAQHKLHTRREMFVEALSIHKEADDVFVVNMDASVRWIDEGMEPHNMLDDLLSSDKAKTTKDGTGKYLIVPFKHNKGPTQATPPQQRQTEAVKKMLKGFKVPYAKIERKADGSPRLGLLHSFSGAPPEPAKSWDGPGQGDGPVGEPFQGPTGIPYLQGVNIYQRMVKDKDGKERVQRDIMTFRVASSKHRGENGRWDHPGLPATNLFDEGAKWALEQWEKKIAPDLMDNIMVHINVK